MEKLNSLVQEKVVRHLKHALEASPDHLPSLIALSEFYLKAGNLSEVSKLLDTNLHCGENPEVSYVKAKLFFCLNDYNRASKAISICMVSDSVTIEQLKLAVEIEQACGNDALAIDYLEQIIDKDPLDGHSHFLLAEKIVTADQFDKKRLLLEIAVSLMPNDSAPLLLLGEHLLIGEKTMPDGSITEKPNYSEAEKNLISALEINPKLEKAFFLRGKIKLLTGKSKEARNYFSKCTEDHELVHLANIEMGDELMNGNHFKEAKSYFKKAKEVKKNKYYPYFKLGLVCMEDNEFSEARSLFETSQRFAEEELTNLEKKSEDFLSHNRFNQARIILKKISNVKNNLSVIHLSIYQIIIRLNEDNHSSHLDQSLEYNPHNSNSLYEKGAQFINSDKESALSYLKRSVEADWFNWEAHFALARINLEDKNLAVAQTHAEIAHDLSPDHQPIVKMIKTLRKT